MAIAAAQRSRRRQPASQGAGKARQKAKACKLSFFAAFWPTALHAVPFLSLCLLLVQIEAGFQADAADQAGIGLKRNNVGNGHA